jgi:CHAT domain-containing protein/tetratricopeptide (TPR) repeat protein
LISPWVEEILPEHSDANFAMLRPSRRLCDLVAFGILTGCVGRTLVPGRTMTGELVGSKRQVIRVTLRQGDAVRLLVEQHHADLVISVTPPGRSPWTIDMRERGLETATLIAVAAGTFEIAISLKGDLTEPVPFELRLDGQPRPVSDRERLQASAEQLETEGKRLATAATPSPAEALRALKEALDSWRRLDDPRGTATTIARVGDVYRMTNRFEQAQAAYEEALLLFRPAGDRHQIAATENNLGAVLYARGALDEARTHFHVALDLWLSPPAAHIDAAATRANEAAMLVEYGDYEAALQRLLLALPVVERHPRHGPPVLNLLGVAYAALGDLDAAEQFFTRARNALPPNDPRLPRLGLRLAQIALNRGEIPLADATAQDALAAVRRTGNTVAEADALNLMGEVGVAAGRPAEAVANHTQALALYRRIAAERGIATALHHLGVANMKQAKLGLARDSLSDALEIRHRIGLRDAEADTLFQLGVLAAEAGSLPLARSHLYAAASLIEDVRGRVSGEYSRIVFFAARQRCFAALIDVLMRMHAGTGAARYAREAFEVAERERAQSLIDALRESGSDVRRGVDGSLLAQRRDEQRQLDFWASRLARLKNQSGPQAAAAAESALATMNQHLTTYRALDGRIRAGTTALSAANPPLFSLPEIQRELLDSDTRLLRVMLGERRSYAWFVGPGSLVVATLPPKAEIEPAARRLVELMRTRPTLETAAARQEAFQRDAEALSTTLLGPFADKLDEHRLLIIADGLLQLVPFAALPEPGRQNPLVVHHEMAMLPSASAIVLVRRQTSRRASAPRALAVVADAVYAEDDPRLKPLQPLPSSSTTDAFDGVNVDRLMLARTEADLILRHAAPDSRLGAFGFDASRDAVKRLHDYRVVHLAAHAVVDDQRPELSGMVLSQFDSRGRRQSGVLRLHEITTEITLRAEVVVLSACSTAVGRDLPGEGLMGLARGFLATGAKSVIASLNNVQEPPTLQLMTTLYDEMLGKNRLRPGAALRAAQLEMRTSRRFADPYFWGSFVFIGDPR